MLMINNAMKHYPNIEEFQSVLLLASHKTESPQTVKLMVQVDDVRHNLDSDYICKRNEKNEINILNSTYKLFVTDDIYIFSLKIQK